MKTKNEERKTKNFGFTLIELLVVISIIGILAALIMANFNAARARARDARRKADLDQVKKAALMYYNDTGQTTYPPSIPWGSLFQSTDGNMIYMKIVPNDPLNQPGVSDSPKYEYRLSGDKQDFCLWAELENKSDSDIGRTKTRCATGCSAAGVSFAADDYVYVVCVD